MSPSTALRRSALVASVLLFAACGGDATGGPNTDAGVDAFDDAGSDAGADSESDTTPGDTGAVDTSEDAVDTSIVGNPCDDGSECEGGLCLELGGATGQCSILCESSSGCPEDWSCVSIAGALGTLQVCAPSGLCIDEDGDGFGIGDMCDGADCDDTNPAANPLATEVCDGIDNDCDGGVDDSAIDVNTACALDEGTCSTGRTVCTGGSLICNPTTNPVAEICDDLDNDCDGTVDEDAADGLWWHLDADGDGFGDKDNDAIYSCSPIDGRVANPLDCDDTDRAVNPAASETDCDDPRDYNCDGLAGSADDDGDGYGACEECDDSDPLNSPVGVEVCDGGDNDCDGIVDEGQSSMASCATGEPGVCDVGVQLCVGGNSLCVRANEPEAELCDGLDNDCDGIADENVIDGLRFYRDADADGRGAPGDFAMGCAPADGYVTNPNDCDDTNPATYLNAAEICDGLDNSCDMMVDEGSIAGTGGSCTTNFPGVCANGVMACTGEEGIQCTPRTPATDEVCNGLDDDCDGVVDNGVINDCGGCSELPGAPGGSCTICSAGTWECTGPDSLVCAGDTCSFVDIAGSGTEICGSYASGAIACSAPGEFDERNADGQQYLDVAMSDRQSFACAINTSGVVDCWGSESASAIIPADAGNEEIQIASHLCARNQSGIRCDGQELLGEFRSMDVRRELVCGLTENNDVICMGGASVGTPVFGGCPGYELTEPGLLENSAEVAAWSSGTEGMVCGVQSGRVACAGCDGRELQEQVPTRGTVDVEFGASSVCALTDSFEVSCYNAGVGNELTENVARLERVTSDGYIALSRTGEVIRPWGRNVSGDRWDIRLPVLPNRLETEFGRDVAIYDNTVVVGAPTGGGRGEVSFYNFDGRTWKQTLNYVNGDGSAGDELGASVALWGDLAVIGAPGSDRYGENAGAVFVFRNDRGNWTVEDVIRPPVEGPGMAFGSSIALEDDRLIVGAPELNDRDSGVGAAFAFRYTEDRFQHVWTAMGTRRDEAMGYAVDISRRYAVVGAPGYDEGHPNGGAVDVYEFTGEIPEFLTRLIAKYDEPGDRFGTSLALHGTDLFVGAPAYETGRAGRIMNFHSRTGDWQEDFLREASDAAPDDGFGTDMAAGQGVLLVTTGRDTYVFSDGGWLEVNYLSRTGSSVAAYRQQGIVGQMESDRVSTILLPFLVPEL